MATGGRPRSLPASLFFVRWKVIYSIYSNINEMDKNKAMTVMIFLDQLLDDDTVHDALLHCNLDTSMDCTEMSVAGSVWCCVACIKVSVAGSVITSVWVLMSQEVPVLLLFSWERKSLNMLMKRSLVFLVTIRITGSS